MTDLFINPSLTIAAASSVLLVSIVKPILLLPSS